MTAKGSKNGDLSTNRRKRKSQTGPARWQEEQKRQRLAIKFRLKRKPSRNDSSPITFAGVDIGGRLSRVVSRSRECFDHQCERALRPASSGVALDLWNQTWVVEDLQLFFHVHSSGFFVCSFPMMKLAMFGIWMLTISSDSWMAFSKPSYLSMKCD